jgi:peroxiredoxin
MNGTGISHEPLSAVPGRNRWRFGRFALPALLLVVILAGAFVLREGGTPQSPLLESAPDLARETMAYLREKKAESLSGPLQTLLQNADLKSVPTEPHPLVNQPAPLFTLMGVEDKPIPIADLLAKGPVVLVFYYGYSCNHCVSQLFDVNEDLRYFTELGTTVVAVSPDSTEKTRKRYTEYGPFGFPVLSDPIREAAKRYGVFRPAIDGKREWQAHGTFVIGRDRIIHWANTGAEPFEGNPTLLRELARLDGRWDGKLASLNTEDKAKP